MTCVLLLKYVFTSLFWKCLLFFLNKSKYHWSLIISFCCFTASMRIFFLIQRNVWIKPFSVGSRFHFKHKLDSSTKWPLSTWKIKETLPPMAPYLHLMALALPLIFLNKESLSARPYSPTAVKGQDCQIINTYCTNLNR